MKDPGNRFTARRAVKVATQRLLAPPGTVFSLLCPTRQKISVLERLLNHDLATGQMLWNGA